MELDQITSLIVIAMMGMFGWVARRAFTEINDNVKKMAESLYLIKTATAVQEEVLRQHRDQLDRTLRILERHDQRISILEYELPRTSLNSVSK